MWAAATTFNNGGHPRNTCCYGCCYIGLLSSPLRSFLSGMVVCYILNQQHAVQSKRKKSKRKKETKTNAIWKAIVTSPSFSSQQQEVETRQILGDMHTAVYVYKYIYIYDVYGGSPIPFLADHFSHLGHIQQETVGAPTETRTHRQQGRGQRKAFFGSLTHPCSSVSSFSKAERPVFSIIS